jgi:hypothetical protein
MSAEATGWVYRHSPYRGAALLIHLAAADSVNDQHGYEFWMSHASVAEKARVSRQSAVFALERMLEDGFFELLERRPGHSNRYRFLFPDVAFVYNPRGVKSLDTPESGGVKSVDNGCQVARQQVSSGFTQNLKNLREPKPRARGKKKTNTPKPCPHGSELCNGVTSFCDRCARDRRSA